MDLHLKGTGWLIGMTNVSIEKEDFIKLCPV